MRTLINALNSFQVTDGSLTMGRATKSGAINHGTDPHILKINGPIRSKKMNGFILFFNHRLMHLKKKINPFKCFCISKISPSNDFLKLDRKKLD